MSEDCPGCRPVTHTTGQRCAIHLWFHLEDVSQRLSITKPIFTILYSNRLSEAACMTKLPELYYYFHFFSSSCHWFWDRACQVKTCTGLPSLTGTQIVISKVTRCWFAWLAVSDWTYPLTNGHRDWAGRMLHETKCLWPQVLKVLSLSPSIPLSLSFFIHIFIAHHSRTGAAKTLQNKVKFKEPPSNSTVFNCKHPISGQKG